jgi:hypothetical protein
LGATTECRREIIMPVNDLEFSISTPKVEYREGDSFPCTLGLTNKHSQPFFVNKRFLVNYPQMQHDVYFEITDENGNKAPIALLINAGNPDGEDFVELDPNSSVSKQVDLARDFRLVPGSYTIKAFYENHTAPPQLDESKIWKGKIESNTLIIKIR